MLWRLNRHKKMSAIVSMALLIGMGAWVVFAGGGQAPEGRPTKSLSLVSIQALPEEGGQMCQWAPASSSSNLAAALWQQRQANSGSVPPAGNDGRSAPTKVDPGPLRVIRDPYALYSAVAVDMERNEIIASDENILRLMVYDRLANTPPSAAMTEPKRIIGGTSDHPEDSVVQYPCGIYVDPQNGDVYSLTNDIGQTLSVFSHDSQGNEPAKRTLRIPVGSFGIAVDDDRQEMFVTVQHPATVLVFKKQAQGQQAPLRILEGHRTRLADPHGVVVDKKNKLLFVSNYGAVSSPKDPEGKLFSLMDRFDQGNGNPVWTIWNVQTIWKYMESGSGKYFQPSINVYPLQADGNTPPLRVLQGPKTQLNWPGHISLDGERGELFVANDVGDSILVFRAGDNGNVAPIRVLKGPQTGVKNPTGVFVDTKNQELVVSNMGNHSITVYPRIASGDTAPLRIIRSGPLGSSGPMLVKPGGVSYDTKRDEILVPN